MKVKSDYTIANTSPNPSKGGEQAVRKINTRKQLPLFRRGLGGGLSGLPRSSYLTDRNDGAGGGITFSKVLNFGKGE